MQVKRETIVEIFTLQGNFALDVYCPNLDGASGWVRNINIWLKQQKEFLYANDPFSKCSHYWYKRRLKFGALCLKPFIACPMPNSGESFSGLGFEMTRAVGKKYDFSLEAFKEPSFLSFSSEETSLTGGVRNLTKII